MTNGIDVSEFQGRIDWNKVKKDFAMIRAGYGRYISQKDKYFDANYSGCKANKIPCGAYWYSYALTPEEARAEAAVCLNVIKGRQFEFPIFLDIEEKRQIDLGREKCSAVARAFLETVEKSGYWVGIYSNQYTLENFISDDIKKRYSVWLASWDVAKPSYSGAYALWQKSNKGSVNGISGNVDLDECSVDFPAEIKAAGLNGFSKPAAAPSPRKKEFIITVDGVTYAGTLTEKQ